MLARANKIKAMFGVQLKEQATLPGISREKTGKSYEEYRAELFIRDVANSDVNPAFTFAIATVSTGTHRRAVDTPRNFDILDREAKYSNTSIFNIAAKLSARLTYGTLTAI